MTMTESDSRTNEQIARDALALHMMSTGSYLRQGGVMCACGEHAYTPQDRANHKADAVVQSLRMEGRLVEG